MPGVKRVAIVGAGFSGTLVAAQLKRQAKAPVELSLFERRPEAGKGIAYSTHTLSHLLNVPAHNMSAFPDDAEHFVRWLEGAGSPKAAETSEFWATISGRKLGGDSFVPRKIYGAYLQDILKGALELTGAGTAVTLDERHEEVIAIEPEGAGYRLSLGDGNSLLVDAVVLALGNSPPALPRLSQVPSPFTSQFARDPWTPRATAGLASDRPVLVLGTGLTMVDIALSLDESGFEGPILALSRHGLLPRVHRAFERRPFSPSAETLAHPTARRLLSEVRAGIESASDWRAVVDGMRPHTQKIWLAMSDTEKRRFVRHVKSYWDVHRHRIAPEVGAVIERLQRSGQLQVLAGRVTDVHEVRDGVDVVYEARGKSSREVVRVQRVINCTGPSYTRPDSSQRLLGQLIRRGLVRPHPVLGLDARTDGTLIGADGAPEPRLFTLGSVLVGVLGETIAVPELRGQAAQTARHVLEALGCDRGRPSVRDEVSLDTPKISG